MLGGQSGDDGDAIRTEPVLRYLANAKLTDPIWRDERIVPSIFGSYQGLFEAMVLAWQQELPRTAAIIARCALDLNPPVTLSEQLVEDTIRSAEFLDSTGVWAQVELLIQERDRRERLALASAAVRALSTPGVASGTIWDQ